MCGGGGGGQPSAPTITPEQERPYLSSLNDKQVANIELQREGWNTNRINSATPLISNLINLNGQQTGLQSLSDQQKQIQASYVTQGGSGGNNYNAQSSDLASKIAAQQTQLNDVTNTPFTYSYTPTVSDQYVSPSATYQQQGNSSEYNAQLAFEKGEQGKNNTISNQFGTSDQNYMSLLDQYNQSVKSLQDSQNQAQAQALAGGAAQSTAQSVTGNQPNTSPTFNNAPLNPKLQQAAQMGVAPLPQSQGLNANISPLPQNNVTGGTLGIKGQSNNINN
jgi:hypothetical protein